MPALRPRKRRVVGRTRSSAGGRRIGEGTYELADLPAGGTRVAFTYAWRRAPLEDRVLAPLARPMMRRALERSLERMADALARRRPAHARPAEQGAASAVGAVAER